MDQSEVIDQQIASFSNPETSRPPVAGQDIAMPGLYAMPEEIVMLFLDSQAQIERVRHNLAGEILKVARDSEGNLVSYWEMSGERKMNDKGIRHIISLLDGYINPNSATSNLTDKEIYAITERLVKTLNGVLRSKGTEFEVDRNYKTTLLNQLGDMVFIELKKAKDGGTLKAMTQSYQVRELKGIGEQKKGFSIGDLSPLNLIKGRQ